MKKILVVGQIVLEQQLFVDKIANANEVSFVNKINTLASSKELNAARILTKKNETDYLACVGSDSNGEESIKYLERYGLNTKWVSSTKKANTGQVFVLTNENGASAITVFIGANDYIETSSISLSKYDFIYTSSANPLDKIYGLIVKSAKLKIPILVDFPNKQKDFDKTYFRDISYIVPNRQEAGLLVDEKILTIQDALRVATKLKSLTNGSVIITLDKDGCVAFEEEWNEPRHFATAKVNVLDMTASGDIFRGMFTNEILQTNDFTKSIIKSLKVATESCTIEGVDSSIKHSIKLV